MVRYLIVNTIEGGQEHFVSAVAEPHPDKAAGVAGPIGEENEVFVLANERDTLSGTICPELQIGLSVEFQIKNVIAVMSAGAQKSG